MPSRSCALGANAHFCLTYRTPVKSAAMAEEIKAGVLMYDNAFIPAQPSRLYNELIRGMFDDAPAKLLWLRYGICNSPEGILGFASWNHPSISTFYPYQAPNAAASDAEIFRWS